MFHRSGAFSIQQSTSKMYDNFGCSHNHCSGRNFGALNFSIKNEIKNFDEFRMKKNPQNKRIKIKKVFCVFLMRFLIHARLVLSHNVDSSFLLCIFIQF
jgi:hypothetical protein